MKFDREVPIQLERDTHLIVAAIGERSQLGPVMGPDHANDRPVAVSNPIFIDVDGGGFKPSNDTPASAPGKEAANDRRRVTAAAFSSCVSGDILKPGV